MQSGSYKGAVRESNLAEIVGKTAALLEIENGVE